MDTTNRQRKMENFLHVHFRGKQVILKVSRKVQKIMKELFRIKSVKGKRPKITTKHATTKSNLICFSPSKHFSLVSLLNQIKHELFLYQLFKTRNQSLVL